MFGAIGEEFKNFVNRRRTENVDLIFIAHAKERGQRAKDLSVGDDFQAKMAQLYAAYDEQCQREGVVDFAELLLRSYELLKHSEPIRTHYQERFRHILIDEFQDTNALQYAWLKLLSGHDASRVNVSSAGSSAVFAVGDDDQSIYAFRGADVENMRLYEKQYHPMMVKLEQNYRSHGHILDTANYLISNNTDRLGKNLRTDAGHGEPVRIYDAPSDHAEAAWFVAEEDVLGNRELGHQRQLLVDDDDADLLAVVDATKAPLGAQVTDLAAVVAMRVDARQHLHQRRFAGAVLADDGVDFTLADGQIDVVERIHAGEGFDDPPHLQNGHR